MTYEQTKEYLSIIMEMEKNVYIQGQTLDKLKSFANSLGRGTRILVPKKEEAYKVEMSKYVIGGGAFGFIGGFGIKMILETVAKSGHNRPQGIFQEISSLGESLWAGLIWGIICMVIGCIIGCIIAAGIDASEEEKKESKYNLDMKEYDRKVQRDNERVKKEKIQQQYVYNQIRILSEQYEKSRDNLQKYYDYNIIDIRYQHDFVAICSFCQYFRSGRTYSLPFDPNTSDEGAYNIYERERQNGLIISKLDEVLIKLDDMLDYQREIQSQLISANKKIQSLSSEVENSSNRLTSAINEHTAIEQYNGECIQRELVFNNTMNAIFSWH